MKRSLLVFLFVLILTVLSVACSLVRDSVRESAIMSTVQSHSPVLWEESTRD